MGSHKDSKTMNVFRPLAFLFVGMLCSSVNMPIFAQEYADKGDPTSSQSVQKPDTDKQEAANEKDDKEKEKEKSKKKPSKLAGGVVAHFRFRALPSVRELFLYSAIFSHS